MRDLAIQRAERFSSDDPNTKNIAALQSDIRSSSADSDDRVVSHSHSDQVNGDFSPTERTIRSLSGLTVATRQSSSTMSDGLLRTGSSESAANTPKRLERLENEVRSLRDSVENSIRDVGQQIQKMCDAIEKQ